MDEAFTTPSKSGAVVNVLRGLAGATLGGVAGYFLFGWLLDRGYYAPILPGALVGLGCGIFIKRRNVPLAIVCGLAGLALGIFSRWKHDASPASNDFFLFLKQLDRLPTGTLLMLGLGGLCGLWFALGSSGAKSKVEAQPAKE